MLIGELAAASGMSRDTIRFYEKQGLIRPMGRRENGYKEYPSRAATQLRFVKGLQERGFTLGEIGELISMSAAGPVTCGEVAPRLRQKLEVIDRKICELEAMKAKLRSGFDCCADNHPDDTCAPIAGMTLR